MHRAAHGYVGQAVIEACRIRDADPVRSALAGSDAPLVVAAADALYRDVLAQGYHGLPAAAFTRVDIQVKSYSGTAWIYLPTGPASSPLRGTAAQSPGEARDQAPAVPSAVKPTLQDFLDTPRMPGDQARVAGCVR